jgi:hypothetical protein
VKFSEAGLGLRKLKTNNEREKGTHWDSELWLKHKHRTSTERLSKEEMKAHIVFICGGVAGKSYERRRVWNGLRIAVLACVNGR